MTELHWLWVVVNALVLLGVLVAELNHQAAVQGTHAWHVSRGHVRAWWDVVGMTLVINMIVATWIIWG